MAVSFFLVICNLNTSDTFPILSHLVFWIWFQVFTSECMRQYLMLFNALWKDKRMEMILSDIWKEQAATSKLCRELPGESHMYSFALVIKHYITNFNWLQHLHCYIFWFPILGDESRTHLRVFLIFILHWYKSPFIHSTSGLSWESVSVITIPFLFLLWYHGNIKWFSLPKWLGMGISDFWYIYDLEYHI